MIITKIKYFVTVICREYMFYNIYLPYLPLLINVFLN